MKRVILISLTIFIILGLMLWNYLSMPLGAQKVSYVPASKECFIGKENLWKYCIHKALQGTNGGIVYLFHGRNLDENTWNDDTYYTSLLQKYWAESNQKPPTIVTVSFGPIWLLAPQGHAEKSGLLDLFHNEVIPEVEDKIGVPVYRGVFGESMGGLNSLIVGLKLSSLFQRVAALCPPIYKDSPFSSWQNMKNTIERTGAEPRIILGVLSLAKAFAADNIEWNSIAPLQLIQTVDAKTIPSLYISAPLYDKYGNFEGAESFVTAARKRGIQTSWHPLYGGHCAIDIVSLAQYLL